MAVLLGEECSSIKQGGTGQSKCRKGEGSMISQSFTRRRFLGTSVVALGAAGLRTACARRHRHPLGDGAGHARIRSSR